MKQVASFSGGRTSAYMCHLLRKMYGDDIDFIFMDTGAEHPKTYEFIKKCNDYFDLNLKCIKNKTTNVKGVGATYCQIHIDDIGYDLSIFLNMMIKGGPPTVQAKYCTDRLKSTPHTKFCNDIYGKNNYVTWLGIRIDEPKRLKNMKKAQVDFLEEENNKINKFRYLAEISDFEKQDILNFWDKMPFNLDIPEYLGNCIFCIHKSPYKLAMAARDEPEKAKEWSELLNKPEVRHRFQGYDKDKIYRGWQSLDGIIASTAHLTDENILEYLTKSKKFDAGSCSESCEAFS